MPARASFVIREIFALWPRLHYMSPVTMYYKLTASPPKRSYLIVSQGIVGPERHVAPRQQVRLQRRSDPSHSMVRSCRPDETSRRKPYWISPLMSRRRAASAAPQRFIMPIQSYG
jgi:hypothetical protein